jgi:drug/metabolite transporter (DMT)-like permease
MLAVVLALVSAIGFGSSDFTAGLAARATSVIRVTLLDQLTSSALVLLIVPWVGARRLSLASAGWGSAAGVAGVAGAMVLYLGFRNAEFSVASTLSAVGSAVLSVVAGLLFGERPSALALTGIVLALPAIAAVSASAPSAPGAPGAPGASSAPSAPGASGAPSAPGASGALSAEERTTPGRSVAVGRQAAGVAYGLVAGVCFALYFVGLARAGSHSGLWPVLAAQLAALVVVLGIGAATRQLGMPASGARLQSVLTGATGIAGTMFFFLASHEGLLAITAVITALYPGGTILLARVLLGERLTRVRLAGLCLAAASVALIAVAGAG